MDDADSFFAGSINTSSMMSVGCRLIDKLFRHRSTSVTETIAKYSGMSTHCASSLLSLVAPLAMGVVGKEMICRGLNASGLRDMLLGQRDEFAAALPPGISQVIGSRPELGVRTTETSARKGLRWLLCLAGLGLFLL